MSNHTKQWLKNQPLWTDKEIALMVSISLVIGFLVGWMVK